MAYCLKQANARLDELDYVVGVDTDYDQHVLAVTHRMNRFAKIVLPALKHVDVCIMNEFEAGRVTGRRIRVGDAHSGAPGVAGLDRKELRACLDES